MIALWMLYGAMVAVLVAAAARGAERVLRLYGRPVRWVWGAALALTLALVAVAPLRVDRASPLAASGATVAGSGAVPAWIAASERQGSRLDEAHAALRRAVAAPLRYAAASLGSGTAVDRVLAGAWAALSVLLLLLFGASYLRFRSARRSWPEAELHGTTVRVAPDGGPAVMGLARPEVVVPRWLLASPAEQQRMVLAHESEHLRAGDPLLLTGGCVLAVLMPWNPAVWWMLSRLRLAVELDCDARVLRRGVEPLQYGSLLLDIAGRHAGLRLGAPALADTPSHLERRLLAMKRKQVKPALPRAVGIAALASAALLVACETRMPTAPEIEQMDVAAAEAGARRLTIVGAVADGSVTYLLDGRQVDPQAARAVAADDIAHIAVHRAKGAEGRIEIVTKRAVEAGEMPAAAVDAERVRFRVTTDGAPTAEGRQRATAYRIVGTEREGREAGTQIRVEGATMELDARALAVREAAGREPLTFIDGVRADAAAMRALRPDDIATIEVLKGSAATRVYSEPGAENGVIRITTRRAATRS